MNSGAFDDVSRKLAGATSRRATLGIMAKAGIAALTARFVPGQTVGAMTGRWSASQPGGTAPLDVVPVAPQPTTCANDDLPWSVIEEPGTSVIEPTPCLKAELADIAYQDESVVRIDAFLSDTHALARSDDPFSLHLYQEGELASTVTLVGYIPEDPGNSGNPFTAIAVRSVDLKQQVATYCALLDRGELSRLLVVVNGDVVDEPDQPLAIRMPIRQIASRTTADVPPISPQSSRKDCSLCVGTCQIAMWIGFAATSILDKGLKAFALHLGIEEYASIRCAQIAALPMCVDEAATFHECYERQKDLCDEITAWVLSADETISKAACQPICEDPSVRGCTTTCIELPCPEGQYYDMDQCQCQCPLSVNRPIYCQGQCVSSVCPDDEVFDYFSCSCGCGKRQTTCDGRCTDIQTESAHCGGCDQPCDGVCSRGVCLKSGSCSEGLVDCDGECVDVFQDSRHCGRCGVSCGDGLCVDGQCAGGGSTCDDGDSLCNGACVDLTSDSYHCGGCDQVCDGTCVDGRCAAPLDCEEGLILCDAACVDPNIDPFHCGSCGNNCDDGGCDNGICYSSSCQGELVDQCFGQCVDTWSDNHNCGWCGNQCEGECSGGACIAVGCDEGQTGCAWECTDTNWDPYNCGGCGNYCDGECSYGECLAVGCGAGLTDCGSCVDTNWDIYNCGGCGNYCDGECSYGECLAAGCEAGLTDCGGGCTDLNWDPYNCGSCGAYCDTECSNGVCFVVIGGD